MAFNVLDKDKQADSMADYLPEGEVWQAKKTEGTVLRKFLRGLTNQMSYVTGKQNEVLRETDINETEALLREWERTFGIPNEFIPIADTTEERRANILLTIQAFGTQIEEQFEALATLRGIDADVTPGSGGGTSTWPWIWPIIWIEPQPAARYTIVVTFTGVTSSSTWPWTWPIVWGIDPTAELRAMYEFLKPANCQILYRYLP